MNKVLSSFPECNSNSVCISKFGDLLRNNTLTSILVEKYYFVCECECVTTNNIFCSVLVSDDDVTVNSRNEIKYIVNVICSYKDSLRYLDSPIGMSSYSSDMSNSVQFVDTRSYFSHIANPSKEYTDKRSTYMNTLLDKYDNKIVVDNEYTSIVDDWFVLYIDPILVVFPPNNNIVSYPYITNNNGDISDSDIKRVLYEDIMRDISSIHIKY